MAQDKLKRDDAGVVVKEPTDAVYADVAQFEGEDHPRCLASPSKDEVQELTQVGAVGTGVIVTGTFGCALPEGHEKFENRKYRPHTWIRIGA